jgi:hypothetical protein
MSNETRHLVIDKIKRFHQDAKDDGSNVVWNKINVLELAGIVALDDVPKLRACYHLWKRDPSILVDPIPAATSLGVVATSPLIDSYPGFSWRPTQLHTAYVESLERDEDGNVIVHADDATKEQYYKHICNHVSRVHPHKLRQMLQPSSHLDVEISVDQLNMMNPTPYDVLIGSMMEESVGEAARKKIAKRRQEVISCNINSYSRSMNNPHQLAMIQDYADLSACVADVVAERDENRRQQVQGREQIVAARAEKKAAALEKDKKKALELLAGIDSDTEKGIEHVLKLPVARKKDIVRYKYEVVSGLARWKKEDFDTYLKENIESLVSSSLTVDISTTAAVLHSTSPTAGAMLEDATVSHDQEKQSG